MRTLTLLLALALVAGCKGKEAPSAPAAPQGSAPEVKAVADAAPEVRTKPLVLTSFYPTFFFANRLGGDDFEVKIACPPDKDPISWMPDDAMVEQLQKADLLLVNGAGYEAWLDKVTVPAERLVVTSKAFESELLNYEQAVEHVHGVGGKHTHTGKDGHTWLDPQNARAQAKAVADALSKLKPELAPSIAERLKAVDASLADLDARFKALSEKNPSLKLLANHPAYAYLAKRYGWQIKSLSVPPEHALSPDAANAIETANAETGARILLWESAPNPAAASAVEAMGLVNVIFAPVEVPPEQGLDYIVVMDTNLGALEEGLKKLATLPMPAAKPAPAVDAAPNP